MLASFYATNFNRKFEDAHFLQKMTSLDFHSFETFFLEKKTIAWTEMNGTSIREFRVFTRLKLTGSNVLQVQRLIEMELLV